MLNLDFTLKKYTELCEIISESNYMPLTFTQYFSEPKLPDKYILIRHDVEKKTSKALKIAQIENKYGIVSTYYCRKTEKVFKQEIIQKISVLGHEIGYHYETMDKTKGNMFEAIKLFDLELSAFREFVDIKTACMHGNPFSLWSNVDMWNKYDLKDFGIIGEPYLTVDYSKVVYFTDTGRTWADKNIRVKDVIKKEGYLANKSLNCAISTTDDIIELIKKENIPNICILVHPDRWCDSFIGWINELILQNIKNVGKAGIVKYRKWNYEKDKKETIET